MHPLRRALVWLLVGLFALAPVACSSSSASSSSSSTATVTPTPRTWGVGRSEIDLVDRSRDTAGVGQDDPSTGKGRALPTIVLYPTPDASDDGSSSDHPVADGRFPLFVFSHGVTGSGSAYAPILEKIAAAGFVVALPTFPLTSGPEGWDHLADVRNQPADVSYVIDELLARSGASGGLLAGHLDPDAVAAGGHSLGAITSLFFFNSCCRDKRIKAVVAISGMLLPAKQGAGNYDHPPADLPLLLLHGEQDKVVPYSTGSKKIFAEFTEVPRALVSFPDGTHSGVLVSPSYVPSVVAFLNLELRDAPAQWQALGKKIADNGDATIEVAGGLPAPR